MASLTYRLAWKFVLAIFGLLLIGSLPALFKGISLDFSSYGFDFSQVLWQLAHPWTVQYQDGMNTYHLFPKILWPWMESMKIYFVSFFCAFILALALTFVTMLMPRGFMKAMKALIFVLESLPDILVIAVLQIAVIAIYQSTGVLISDVASYGHQDQAFLLPIIVMTILPAIMLFRTMLLDFEEEETKLYVELAKSKGLKKEAIMLFHILRNAMIQIFLDSKFVLWIMLSNLFIVEYLFNIRALTNFIFEHPTPIIFTIGLLLLFLPIFVFLAIGQIIIEKTVRQKVEV